MNKKVSKTGIKNRIDLIISELGISGRAFSKACGFSESYYTTINDGIGADKLNSILSKYPQFSAQWLITGQGGMFAQEQEDTTNQTTDDMIQEKFFEALERRDRQFEELLEHNRRLIVVIENITGTIDFRQSNVG